MRPRQLLVAAALVLGTADGAFAAWSTVGGGQTQAGAAVLAAATGTTVTWDPVVHVGWTSTTSDWAAGHRVFRAVAPGGPFTQVADVPLGTSTVDDAPGAGTHYYTVQAYRGAWRSAASPVAARADATYVITGAAPPTTTGCAASSVLVGMQQGFVPSGTGTSRTLGTTTFGLCSDTWTTGQSIPAGTTTVTAYVANSHTRTACSVVVGLSVAGGSLGSTTVSIPAKQTADSPVSWPLSTSAKAFATGDRATLTLAPAGGAGCDKTILYAGSSTYPSRVTLTG